MAAPIPVVKESLRADPDRQRQMVTLKRPTKSSAPASSSGGSSSAAKTEDLQRVAKQSSVVEKSTTQVNELFVIRCASFSVGHDLAGGLVSFLELSSRLAESQLWERRLQ